MLSSLSESKPLRQTSIPIKVQELLVGTFKFVEYMLLIKVQLRLRRSKAKGLS